VGLIEDIGRGPVGLDTAVFIYFIEEHPSYLPLVEPVFAAIDSGPLRGLTSGDRCCARRPRPESPPASRLPTRRLVRAR
jgi:hypothetical protein